MRALTLQCVSNMGYTVLSLTTITACFLVRTTHCENEAHRYQGTQNFRILVVTLEITNDKETKTERKKKQMPPEILSSSFQQESQDAFLDYIDLLLCRKSCIHDYHNIKFYKLFRYLDRQDLRIL